MGTRYLIDSIKSHRDEMLVEKYIKSFQKPHRGDILNYQLL